MTSPRKLPRPKTLLVEEKKIRDYLLNIHHKDGAAKANFFLARGFKPEDWEDFAEALRQHGRERSVTGVEENDFGTKYMVECSLESPDGRNPCVVTVWIEEAELPIRLITARPYRD